MNLRSSPRVHDLAVIGTFVTLTAVLTWPQGARLSSVPGYHQDPLFSIWRLAWIANALGEYPSRLFDGNIFYPEKGTLLYSDSTLLQGLIAAPFIWLGVPAVAAYNLLVLASFVACGWAMFVLGRHLTQSRASALVAGVVFAFAPFRFDHYVHLELLSGFWTPLALWAFHRATTEGSGRHGLLAGVFAALQLLSCIYYGVFLSPVLLLFAVLTLSVSDHRRSNRWKGVAAGGALAAIVAAVYAVPYLQTAEKIGVRGYGEVVRYSPDVSSLVAAPGSNVLWGWTSSRWGGNEGHLFLGVTTLVLLAVGLASWRTLWVRSYGVLLLFAVLLSLGVNGPIYGFMYEWWPGFSGLRVSSRAGHLLTLSAAVLAAQGHRMIAGWLRTSRIRRLVIWSIPLALIMEFATRNEGLTSLGTKAPSVYTWLAAQEDVVVLDYPVPAPHSLPGQEAMYQWLSTFHWRPLVNGYSGSYPRSYLRLLHDLRRFPDRRAIRALAQRRVRFIIVHLDILPDRDFRRLRRSLLSSADLKPIAAFRGMHGERLYVIELMSK